MKHETVLRKGVAEGGMCKYLGQTKHLTAETAGAQCVTCRSLQRNVRLARRAREGGIYLKELAHLTAQTAGAGYGA